MSDVETATRYLRGELDDLDRTVFEERLLEDDAVHQAVLAAEDELLDAHVADQLDEPVRGRLVARLAAEPALRRRLALARALFQHAATPSEPAVRPPAPRRARMTRWWAAAGVVVMVAIAVVVLRGSGPSRGPELVTLTMEPPTRRSSVPVLVVPAGSRRARLVLDVPSTAPAQVRVAGPRGDVAVVVAPATAEGVVVELDAAALVAGLHEISVGAGGTVVVFQLRVERR